MIIVPITVLVIFLILYTMFHSFKWAALDSGERGHGAHRAGCWRLLITGTHFSVSSGVGFLASVRRIGADRRDHAGVHQPAARARH